jgi:hypothetical protein
MTAALTVASSLTCPHAGRVSTVPSQVRVLAAGSPVLTQADLSTVAGCAFTIPTAKPSPCVTVRWTVAATRVLVQNTPVLTQVSTGLGTSPEQAPQGPVVVTATQPRVLAL